MNNQLNNLNQTLIDLSNTTKEFINSTNFEISSIILNFNNTIQTIQNNISNNIQNTTTLLLNSIDLLNTTFTKELFLSKEVYNNQFQLIQQEILSNFTFLKDDTTLNFEIFEFALSDLNNLFNNTIDWFNNSLQTTNNQISILSSNTSQAIARSNAILTRVIADVNISFTDYKNVSVTYFETMFHTFTNSLLNLQNSLETEFEDKLQLIRSNITEISENFENKIIYLNNSFITKFNQFEEQFNNTISLIQLDLLLLQSLTISNFTRIESKIENFYNNTISNLLNESSNIKLIINETENKLLNNIHNQSLNISNKLIEFQINSSQSLFNLYKVILQLGNILYPHSNISNMLLSSQNNQSYSDLLNYFYKISNDSIIVDILNDKIHLLDEKTENNITQLLNDIKLQHLQIYDLINITKQNLTLFVNNSSLNLNNSIIQLNNLLLDEKNISLNNFNELKDLLKNESLVLNLRIKNNSELILNELFLLEFSFNETIYQLSKNISKSIEEVRYETNLTTNKLELKINDENNLIYSNISLINKNLNVTENQLNNKILYLKNDTLENLQLVQRNLLESINLTKWSLLNNTILPLQELVFSNYLIINNTILNLNSSLISNIIGLNQSILNQLQLIKQNISIDNQKIFSNISLLNISTNEQFNNLKKNISLEFINTNSTIYLLNNQLKNFTNQYNIDQLISSNLWKNNTLNISLLSSNITSSINRLNSSINLINSTLFQTFQLTKEKLGIEWNQTFILLNRTIRNEIDKARGLTNNLTNELKKNLTTFIDVINTNMTLKHNQLSLEFNKTREELLNTINLKNNQTKDLLIKELQLNHQNLSSSMILLNQTLSKSMIQLLQNVNITLEKTLKEQEQRLINHTLIQDGKLNLLTHQINRAENLTSKALNSLDILTIDTTILKSDVHYLTNNLKETSKKQNETILSLKGVELNLLNITNQLLISQNDIKNLKIDNLKLENKFDYILMNTSHNSYLLNQIFHTINISHESQTLWSKDLLNKTSLLNNEIETSKQRIERIENKIGNITFEQVINKLHEEENNRIRNENQIKETIKLIENKLLIGLTKSESLEKQLQEKEYQIKNIYDYELTGIKKSIEESKIKCETLVGKRL